MAADFFIGESLVGEGNEIAHVDLIIGSKAGHAGQAFVSSLSKNTDGFTSLLAVVTPNLPAKPDTLLFNKVTIKNATQAVQMFGTWQRPGRQWGHGRGAALPPLDCFRPRLPDHRGAQDPMRKLLLQLDSSRLPSAFDQVVAYDAGADEIMSYGGVTESDVRDLVYGCLFTRGPKDLQNTAVWIGGTNMTAGEQLLAMAVDAKFGPRRGSIMLDSNGLNINAGAAGIQIAPRAAWTGVKTLKIAVDLNAVPPPGIEGVDVNDAGVVKDGVTVFGAFGVGNFKTKLHKACIARLFTRNDLVLDAEAIAEVARELVAKQS